MAETRVSAAVVQAAPIAFDVEATLAKVERLTGECAAGGAQLMLFPEAFVSCYPRGLTFGTPVGSRSPEGRTWFRRYWESSLDVPGPRVDRLGEIAAEHGVHLVIGVIERDGGTLYCTALFFDQSGAYMRKHRELMPTAAERLVWGTGDGSTLPVFDTPLGRLGAAICWENYMPLLRMAMYAKGIQLWCAPNADAWDSWVATTQHIACEGRCFVLSANQFARRSDYPEEAILRAELNLGKIAEGKYDFDVVGHYNRPDVFRLTVDERPGPRSSLSGQMRRLRGCVRHARATRSPADRPSLKSRKGESSDERPRGRMNSGTSDRGGSRSDCSRRRSN